MLFYVTFSSSGDLKTHLPFSGYFDILKEIPGPVEFLVEINKCNADMTKCDKFATQKFSNFCRALKDKKSFYYEFLKDLQPQLSCPFQPRRYVVADTSVDLTMMAVLPLSGNVWMLRFRTFSGKQREQVFCATVEVKVVWKGSKRN